MKIRVKLIREYELKYDREELAEEHGIDSIEEITDMEELDSIDDAAGTITTWIEPGSIEVFDNEDERDPT